MYMEILGNVKKINDIQTFASGFKKRELILTTNEQYPQNITIDFVQEKINLLDNIKVGDDIKVSISIKGREWTNNDGITKNFNTIQGWRIEVLNKKNNFYKNNTSNTIDDSNNENNIDVEETFDDLPF